jgi:hypothetical protein
MEPNSETSAPQPAPNHFARFGLEMHLGYEEKEMGRSNYQRPSAFCFHPQIKYFADP